MEVMNYNLSYDISALIILLFFFFIYAKRKKVALKQNRIFLLFMSTVILSTFFDILDVLVFRERYIFPHSIRSLSAFFYYFFHICIPFVYTYYILSIADIGNKKNRQTFKLVLAIPQFLTLLSLVLNFSTSHIFFIVKNEYCHGPYFWLLYANTLIYMIFCTVYIISMHHLLPANLLSVHLFSSGLVALASIIQILSPNLLVQNFTITTGILIFYVLIQKPENALDSQLGIFNSKSFLKVLDMNQKRNTEFTLIVCHIEDARLINQMLGTTKMDFILKDIAKFLEDTSKQSVFYLGSSTFVITVYSGKNDSFKLLQTIEKRFEKPWFVDENCITVSIRLMDILLPEDIESIGDVFNYIDYLKELDNRQKWIISAKNINLQDKRKNIEIEQCIHRALDENNFEMYYQPIYNVHTGKIESAEALIRLRDPEFGFVSPADFIPLAERTGLILRIGDFITSSIFCFMKNNDLQTFGIKYIEMNLSVIQCMQESFAHNFMSKIEEYGISPDMLNLEITETATTNSPKVLIKNINSLNRRGLSFSLDDFGTGNSNIRSLLDLPIDIIKFDKSMIDTATVDEKGRLVIESSIVMAKNLGKHIVAEGIETEEQTKLFAAMGCDYFQGYYFSRPLPAQDFLSFVRKFNFRDVYCAADNA